MAILSRFKRRMTRKKNVSERPLNICDMPPTIPLSKALYEEPPPPYYSVSGLEDEEFDSFESLTVPGGGRIDGGFEERAETGEVANILDVAFMW